jgi:AcrR family transcriptional regulator
MYKGHNKTACTNQQQISEAFLQLLQNEPYEEITVSELCKEAGVSRQTFYTLFQKKENVLLYEINKNYSFCCEAHCTKENVKGLLTQYIKENQSFLKILIDQGYSNLLYDTFYEAFKGFKDEYYASFIAGGMISMIQKFVENDTPLTTINSVLEELSLD